MSEDAEDTTLNQLSLLPEEIHARHTRGRDLSGAVNIPTYPATSCPWSGDCDHNGFSARMFLHQLSITSLPRWQVSDTERLLSEWTPLELRGNPGCVTSLSDAIKPPGQTSPASFRSARMAGGLVRRALARGRSLRVLLRTEHDTIPVIVTFGNNGGCESWTLKSEKPLPDFLADGLMDVLKQSAPGCVETP